MTFGLKVQILVEKKGFNLESAEVFDICPFCSQIEDHRHHARMVSKRPSNQLLDGQMMTAEARQMIFSLVRGAR